MKQLTCRFFFKVILILFHRLQPHNNIRHYRGFSDNYFLVFLHSFEYCFLINSFLIKVLIIHDISISCHIRESTFFKVLISVSLLSLCTNRMKINKLFFCFCNFFFGWIRVIDNFLLIYYFVFILLTIWIGNYVNLHQFIQLILIICLDHDRVFEFFIWVSTIFA